MINVNIENNQLTLAFVKRVGISISILIGVIVSLGFFFMSYNSFIYDLNFKTKIKAYTLEKLVIESPQYWYLSEGRIEGILKRDPFLIEDEWAEVILINDEQIMSVGSTPNIFYIETSHPIKDLNKVVAYVRIQSPVTELIDDFFFMLLICFLLSESIWIIIKYIPLKALEKAENDTKEAVNLALTTLNTVGDSIITVNNQLQITYVNSTAQKLLGLPLTTLVGKNLADTVILIKLNSKKTVTSSLINAMSLKKETSCEGNGFILNSNGASIAIEERSTPILSSSGVLLGGVLCLRDVSDKRAYIDKQIWEATHDSLTGLTNRREFERKLSLFVQDAVINKATHTLCYIDLDRFKIVNDTCGHLAGDQLLIKLSNIMQSYAQKTDCIARVGGDEFAFIFDNCNIEQGEKKADIILKAIKDFNFYYDNHLFHVGLSIGISEINFASENAISVQKEADSACYWSKEQGKGRISRYLISDTEQKNRREQISWVSRINNALKENRFTLYYQSYRSLNGDSCNLHIEVLIRMIDESGNIVMPASFLPTAERYDKMSSIDRWVITHVFSKIEDILHMFNKEKMTININLSALSISDNWLFPFLKDMLTQHNVDPKLICFEITESSAVKNLDTAIELIKQCQSLGFRFALDDFGTGTSSFSYLHKLPVNYLKIDGSFICDIETDPIAYAMTKAIHQIANQLNKQTVAEFTETEEGISLLKEIGINYAQGYAVCKPTPLFPDILCIK